MKTVLSTIWAKRRQIRADRHRSMAARIRPVPRMDAVFAARHQRIQRVGLPRPQRTRWAPTAPVRRAELADGRLPHESHDRRAHRRRRGRDRTAVGGSHGIAFRCARVHIGGGGRRADLHSDGAYRIDSFRAVRASAAVVIAACGCAYGLNLARILRPSALLAARSAYVESALWSGASSVSVFFTHIVPNTLPVLCVQLSMSAGTSLLAEAGLTYLASASERRAQLGAFAVHVREIHQHLSHGRPMPGLVVTWWWSR